MTKRTFTFLVPAAFALSRLAAAIEGDTGLSQAPTPAPTNLGSGLHQLDHLAIHDSLKDKLVINRVRSGYVEHNGTINYAITDKEAADYMRGKGPLKGAEPDSKKRNSKRPGPPVREINRVIDVKTPLIFRVDPASRQSKVDLFSIERQGAAPADPLNPPITPLGTILLRPGDNPREINSSIKVDRLTVLPAAGPSKGQAPSAFGIHKKGGK